MRTLFKRLDWARRFVAVLIPLVFFSVVPFASAQPSPPAGGEPDNRIWAGLLARHVQGKLVDYAGFKRDEALLDKYLAVLEAANPEAMSREARFAYYINVYNAWTIKLILTRWPNLESIKDFGTLFRSPWKIELVKLQGQTKPLDWVEHEVLRPRFKDARVHFAINCASKGCPPLINEPYEAARLNEQLDRVTRATMSDPAATRLEGETLYVISVFDWFSGDFPEGAPAFVKRFAEPDLAKRLEILGDRVKVRFIDWDWKLNDVGRR